MLWRRCFVYTNIRCSMSCVSCDRKIQFCVFPSPFRISIRIFWLRIFYPKKVTTKENFFKIRLLALGEHTKLNINPVRFTALRQWQMEGRKQAANQTQCKLYFAISGVRRSWVKSTNRQSATWVSIIFESGWHLTLKGVNFLCGDYIAFQRLNSLPRKFSLSAVVTDL